ncbi:MAG: YiiX/YebB-like N1pC/P60 family cysteine hydrolase [Chryseolinea sp.]
MVRRSSLVGSVAVSAWFLVGLFSCSGKKPDKDQPFQNGDVIFQSVKSSQSDAIHLASHSKYSHCGIIFWEGNKCYVYEAFKKVKPTPIDKFLERSEGMHYAVRRPIDSTLFSTNDKVNHFINTYYKVFNGKPYDVLYAESDDKIYCSELVWKLYKTAANVDVGEWKRLRDFDLESNLVQEQLKFTYRDAIPMDEPIISPEALYVSDKFVTVKEQ